MLQLRALLFHGEELRFLRVLLFRGKFHPQSRWTVFVSSRQNSKMLLPLLPQSQESVYHLCADIIVYGTNNLKMERLSQWTWSKHTDPVTEEEGSEIWSMRRMTWWALFGLRMKGSIPEGMWAVKLSKAPGWEPARNCILPITWMNLGADSS